MDYPIGIQIIFLSRHIDISNSYYRRYRRANRNPISVDVNCSSLQTRGLQKQNCDLEDLKMVALELSKETNSVSKYLTTKQEEFQNLKQVSKENTTKLDGQIRDRTDFLANLTKTRNDLEVHYNTLVKLSTHQTIKYEMYLNTEFENISQVNSEIVDNILS